MILSKNALKEIAIPGVRNPAPALFDLPEKVLQFGTGVLLRGLPDYYIDKANKQGIFNGRVVVVKSTDTGTSAEFDQQDSLYTLYIKGIANGENVNEQVICSSISRVLTAGKQWDAILDVARSADLQIIISNTTEIGIQLIQDDITQYPPKSFPGKLLAVLHERYKAFDGSAESGLVIVPTELIVNNGKKLESIVLELAHLNKLEPAFMDWLENHNTFCDSLVDRIVPGKPSAALNSELETECGYEDELRIVSEVYSLWAIEGDEKVKSVLSFAQADAGVVIAPDIEIFRELKLRLLNGTHTLSCAVAFLSGFKTVKLAMDDAAFSNFINNLMLKEIAPAIPYEVDEKAAADFAAKVLDRFRNPNIEHQWISISAQYTSKLKMRVVPLLLNHYKKFNTVPESMALGFAAYLEFMKSTISTEQQYIGHLGNVDYLITDAKAGLLHSEWAYREDVVNNILKNTELWDTDLTQLPGFAEAVEKYLHEIEENGVLSIIENFEYNEA